MTKVSSGNHILTQSQQIQVDLVTCDKVSVCGDRHRLRQLLLVLTDNAIKYNHPRGRVEMALKRNGHAAELKISNTGAGISATLPRVFDAFFAATLRTTIPWKGAAWV